MSEEPIFTNMDVEIALIELIRRHTIRITHDGRIEVEWAMSREFVAEKLYSARRTGRRT